MANQRKGKPKQTPTTSTLRMQKSRRNQTEEEKEAAKIRNAIKRKKTRDS